MVLLFPISFSSHALTSKTSNAINGSAPYFSFDGGLTRIIDSEGLFGISLSDGTQFTPLTNTSSTTSIELPIAGQSFADINMLVPTGSSSIAFKELISPPYNYWGDDDGDGDISAHGYLMLSIYDKNDKQVSRDTVLDICKAPYRIKLSSTGGQLATRYGVPNRRTFQKSYVEYFVKPKASFSVVCFARPNLSGSTTFAGPDSIWDKNTLSGGFIPQSFVSSSYHLNFPTTGAHGLYFDLDVRGIQEVLSWATVSHGGITATMTNSSRKGVRVTLTGPAASLSQHSSDNPGRISKPNLPQTFELVGRGNNGNVVVKYGFVLKQWFVNRGDVFATYPNTLSWCNNIGYDMPKVKDLTNASCQGSSSGTACQGSVGATPSSSNNSYQRQIGAGFFTEWGYMDKYLNVGFINYWYWTGDLNGSYPFIVSSDFGSVSSNNDKRRYGLCSSKS